MASYDVASNTCQVIARHVIDTRFYTSCLSRIASYDVASLPTSAGPYNAVAAATGPHIQVWPGVVRGVNFYFNCLGEMAKPNGVMLGRSARH